MVVRVRLHTTLQRRTAEGLVRQLEIELPALSTLADLFRALDLPPDPKGLLLVVNGRTAELSRVLEDADEVHLIPALSGG